MVYIAVFALGALKMVMELGISFSVSFNDFEFCLVMGIWKLVVFFVTLSQLEKMAFTEIRFTHAYLYTEVMAFMLGLAATVLYGIKYKTSLKKLEDKEATMDFEERLLEMQ